MDKSKITKYKNGNLKIKIDLSKNSHYLDGCHIDIDKFYNQEMFMCDLNFNHINGVMYLVDYNKKLVYDFLENQCMNTLSYLKMLLEEGKGTVKFYPLSKVEAKKIMENEVNFW
jgi:hypothetical protein